VSEPLPLAAAQARLGRPGRPRKPRRPEPELQTSAPSARLLDLVATGTYLGVSGWTVRDLEAAGILKRVRVPLPNGGELRKVLFDREDLDRLITAWKDPGP
jgi:hypothetical protein